VTGIVGPSGAGKTSLLRCLNRLEEPDRGNITLDGVDISAIDPIVLRRRVGMIFQTPAVFAGGVRANLAYGLDTFSEDELVADRDGGAVLDARVSPEPRYLIPIGGMLIGNSMTAVSLAGSRLRDEIVDKRLEIEARLALGVPAKTALLPYARRAAATALIPTIDSTKNVGLIFLPGAFVGMMLAGASPADAAVVQLVVLFMLLGAVAVAGMTITVLVARGYTAPGERIVIPKG
jgi:hypothetical protein